MKSGQVYSAFYATRCQSLAYDGTDKDGVLNISAAGDNRSYDNRRGRLLGYYSVEDYVNVVELKPVRLKVTTINLVNSETLSLNWTSNSRHDNLDVKFLITFYDDTDGKELFSTEIDGKDIDRKGIAPEQKAASQMIDLELKMPPAGASAEKQSIGKWTFPLNYQSAGSSGGRFSLVLDGMMTAELMEVLKAKSGETLETDPASPLSVTPKQQYSTSITRLGSAIPALESPLNIYAEIQVEPTYYGTTGEFTEYEPSSKVKSNVENTLYAESKVKNNVLEAKISRFRHLSNIRYYDKEKKAEFTLTARNLDWTSAGIGMYGMEQEEAGAGSPSGSGGFKYRKLAWNSSVKEDEILDFPSIDLLSENHTLQGGWLTSISNLKLGENSMPNDELIEQLYQEADREKNKTRYLGLFCEAEGTIQNLTLSDPTLALAKNVSESEGSKAIEAKAIEAIENFDGLYGVGILCGRSQGTLTDISVKTTEKDRQILTVCLKNREDGTAPVADDKPAGIGGLVGVLAGRNDNGTLVSLNQLNTINPGAASSATVISDLTVEGTITGILPAPAPLPVSDPADEAGIKTPQQRAESYQYGVGGIFGYGLLEEAPDAASVNRAEIKKCKNHASVNGNLFTGGICGYLKDSISAESGDAATKAGSMTECENDGLILCLAEHKDEDAQLEGRYFGGLVGFGHKAKIDDSASASGRAKNYSYNFAQKDTVLLGQYVGGIIGYGNSCQIAGCKTEKGGYVLGSDYVGGIAGGLSNDASKAITGTTGSSGIAVTTNAGYVIGNRYVGGIVGKNDGENQTAVTNCINNGVAAGYDCYIGGIVGYNGDNGYLVDCASYLSDYSGTLLKTIREQWKTTGDCSGGLAGYNNGGIKFTDESQNITVKSVSSIVVGKNYVGGVIGFNDSKGTLEVNYTLIGGQIYADGDGVGGCIGLNASTSLLTQELTIKPASVTGNYYVGGCIGANVVDLVKRERPETNTGDGETQTDPKDAPTDQNTPKDVIMDGLKADNTLGSITGKAFTGGVIGYQRTYTQAQLNKAAGLAAGEDISLLDYLNRTGEKEADKEGGNTKEALPATALPLLPKLDEALAGGKVSNIPTKVLPSENTYTLTIGNKNNSADLFTANNIPVYCDLYTGGIVGYCERSSELVIVNCKNTGRLSKRETGMEAGAGTEGGAAGNSTGEGVSLKAYLGSDEVNADVQQIEEDIRVSIGGGIIGANLDHQVIDHCENAGTMNGFIGLGGIVGFNAGGVFNCALSDNFGNAGLNYIGGIVGLNVQADSAKAGIDVGGESGKTSRNYTDTANKSWGYTSGLIAACSTKEGIGISGKSFVGGIAGYNLSGAELRANQNQADITAASDYVGGIAGANLGEIYASGVNGGKDYTIAGNNGQGIGGIVGWNRSYGRKKDGGESSVVCGSIYVTVPQEDITKGEVVEVVAVGSNVTVTGREKVGGIIGINEGILDASHNESSDSSSINAELVCRAKLVRATQNYAGGIIGEARAGVLESGTMVISRAVNRSEKVTADNGRAGDIVAVNNEKFTLRECRNVGNVNSDQGYAGGIAAENYGLIVKCSVGDKNEKDAAGIPAKIEIRSQGADAIGAVCAVNYGTIWSSSPVARLKDDKPVVEVVLSGTARLAGGIAGKNAVKNPVDGKDGTAGEIGKSIEDKDYTYYAVDYMPSIDITASALTVGGVAGLNESGSGSGATIADITVQKLKFEEFKNYQYLGGIVGENQGDAQAGQTGALVANCLAYGEIIKQAGGSETGNCYGGITGKNGGRLEGCQVQEIAIDVVGVYTATATSTAEDKENNASHVGGIAGKNEKNGVITKCLIDATGVNEIKVNSGMAGGIAGYNKGSIELSGDAVTAKLMDGGKIGSVEDLKDVAAADKNIKADSTYVGWNGNRNVNIEDQVYNNENRNVNADRSLSLIVSDNGNLGGIAAYNAPTGEVNYCATGNWFLNNKLEAIGVGTGGIIGMNESERNLSFLLNQAFVGRQLQKADTNRFAGGIIGNQNNTTASGWTIQSCVNYGTVYCRNTHYSGGIIGQWTGSGGNIENCYNYGNLQTTFQAGWQGAAAGIVAQLYHAYEGNEYNIVGCGNFGSIYARDGQSTKSCANDSAGILGNVTAYGVGNSNSAQKYTINVIDCVNGAGVEIYSGSMASGIVGFFSCDNPNADRIKNSTANIVLNIERCRNYAAKLQGEAYVGGILGDRYGEDGSKNTILKYCFSVNRGSGDYNKINFPIISYNTGNSKSDALNGGEKGKVYNYFLSENTKNSFVSWISDNTENTNLERANTGWVYSVTKNGTRYFIYLKKPNNNIDINNLTFDGVNTGDKVRRNNQEIGEVLFIEDTRYDSVNSVTNDKDISFSRKFDEKVRKLCYEMAGKLLAPEKVTLTKTESSDGTGDGNPFTIEVSAPAYAQGEVSYVAVLYRKDVNGITDTPIPLKNNTGVYNITGVTPVPGSNNSFEFSTLKCTFNLSEEIIKEGGEIYVKVKAVQKQDDAESEEVESNLVTIGNVLPDPELRIELIENGTDYAYRLSLEEENLEKYKKYVQNLNELQVHVKRMDSTTEIEFNVDDVGKMTLTQDSLQQLVVQVKDTNDIKASKEISVPVYLPAYKPLIALTGSSVPSYTVTGNNLKDLRIQVAIEGSGGSVTTPPIYRAELIGAWKDEAGNVYPDTVFQSADILTTASGQATAVFTNLPEYIASASDIKVRVWYAESGLGPVYTYSDKLANGSAVNENTANVKTLKKVTATQPDGTQTDVYEWEYAYTPVLNGNYFNDYRWESSELFKLLPEPKLMDNQTVLSPEEDAATGHLQYTFKWDEAPNYQTGSEYIVSLAGIVKDESTGEERRVSILTNQEVTDKDSDGKSYFITPDAENWSYSQVELTVTRKGDISNPNNIVIGQTSTEIYQVKQRLPQPAQPKVTLISNDELEYEIEWDAIIPETGCDSYKIYVQPYEADNLTLGAEKEVAQIPVIDADGNPTKGEDGVYKTTVNLEDYAGNRVVIYLKALPAEDDNSYVRSVDGVTYSLDVPDRLNEPKIKWEKDWEHKTTQIPDSSGETIKETILTVDDFQDGQMTVSVEADDDSIPPGDSAYLLKAYVFNTEDEADAAKAVIGNGAEGEIAGLETVYPVPGDEEGELNPVPVSMEVIGSDGKNYSHDLAGLSAKYAGKYIVFYARISSGGGNISSPWVSSDTYQLPYVKLPTPEVEIDSEDSDIDVTLIYNPDLPDNSISTFGQERKDNAEEGKDKIDGTADDKLTDKVDETESGKTTDKDDSLSDEDETDKTSGGAGTDETDKTPDGTDPDETDKTPGGTDTDETDKTSGGAGTGETDRTSGGAEEDKSDKTSGGSNANETNQIPDKAEEDKADKSLGGAGTDKADKASESNKTETKAEFTALTMENFWNRQLLHENKVFVRNPVLMAAAKQVYRTTALEQLSQEEVLGDDGAGEAYGEEVLADNATENISKWTAKQVTLSWDSVELADSYYIMLTAKAETEGADDKLYEFKIEETKVADGTVESVSVFWKGDDGNWKEILESADATGEYELSQYQREVNGYYQKETNYEVPYRVNLAAKLKVEEAQEGRYRYTLILPDAESLTPKDGGNSIVDEELRFTKSVQIYSDVVENESSPGSEAYVRSDPYEMKTGGQ